MMILWLLLLGTLVPTLSLSEDVHLESLPDGMIVTTDDKVKELRGTWTLFLSLRTPNLIFAQDLDQFRENKRLVKSHTRAFTQFIGDENGHNNSYDLELYHGHLAALDNYFVDIPWTSQRTRSRTSRSINFVGDGLSWAFGVATKNQLRQVASIVADLVNKEQMDHHVLSDLYSVVNQEHFLLNETRSALTSLHSEMNSVITRYAREFGQVHNRIITNQLGNMINALETQAALIRSRLMEWHNLKNNLEHSYLDEYVLPPTLYSKISTLVLRLGLSTLSSTWYHEHVPTNLEGFTKDTYFYRIDLPLIGHDDFTLANFHTWPVPATGRQTAYQLKLKNKIVFNTRIGYFFEPSKCEGRNPIVCSSSATYASNALLCERSILLGHQSVRQLCPVEVTPFNETLIYPLHQSQYVVSMPALPLVISCSNQRQRQVSKDVGTYLVHLDASCTLAAPTWSLRGLIHRSGNFSVEPFHRLQLVPLKFDLMMNIKHHHLSVTLPDLNLSDINTLPTLHWSGLGSYGTWYTHASDHITWIVIP